MSVYAGKYPVFVSHAKELEQMLYFTGGLQQRLLAKGKASGEKYDCLLLVRRKCTDLLLRMYAEDSPVILLDEEDHRWVKKIVGFVKTHLLKDHRKAG